MVCLLPDYSLRLSDYPFETTMGPSGRALWVRGVRLITTLWQTSWFFFGQVLRLCSPSTWSFCLASRAFFGAHRVSFRPFQWIEICSAMPHWGIFLSHHFLVVRHSEPPSLFSFGVQSHHHHFLVWRSESHLQFWRLEPSLSHSRF